MLSSPDGLVVKVQHAPPLWPRFQFPGTEPHHSSVSSHAVVDAHVEETEEFTTVHNYVLGLWGKRKEKGGKLATDVSLG